MSRIRSLHPGLFTDDAYMTLSMAARELIKGLWCEADDNGIFVWKPLTIKARIFPADNLEIGELLAELECANFIAKFEHDGKSYGAIRNFLKFQKPRRPSVSHPIPQNAAKYLGSQPVIPDLKHTEDDEFPTLSGTSRTLSGKSPLMEDGGGKGSSVSSLRSETAAEAATDDPVKAIFDRGIALFSAANVPERQARSIIGQARRSHGIQDVMAAIVACEDERPSEPVAYFERCLNSRPRSPPRSNGGYVPMHPGAGG